MGVEFRVCGRPCCGRDIRIGWHMLCVNQVKLPIDSSGTFSIEAALEQAARDLGIPRRDILEWRLLRCSVDARKKPDLYYICNLALKLRGEAGISRRKRLEAYAPPQFAIDRLSDFHGERPVVVGAGPAGLFCAYYLAKAGLEPLLLERGQPVERRVLDVARFWQEGLLDRDSNVSFGEGGAGTFSDGKLHTLVKDRDGRGRLVLETLVECGAPEEILYEAKAHIGTDVLEGVVVNLRRRIEALGGEICFGSRLEDIELESGRLVALTLADGRRLPAGRAALALGHSARDSFAMLYRRGLAMEAKAFAVGFRLMHRQKNINLSQYGRANPACLGAAPYKLAGGASLPRPVYSFCMCPGGYVVDASTEPGRVTVNGMSYAARDGEWANSAIVMGVQIADFPGSGPLAGIEWQRQLEERAHAAGGGRVPVQRYGDFLKAVGLEEIPGDGGAGGGLAIKGLYAQGDLSGILPPDLNRAFARGMRAFGRQIPGFDGGDVWLAGVESRTSSPLRILRGNDGQSINIKGIYPCGEGAGYAGGITSAAMDGLAVGKKMAEAIANGE